MKKFKYIIVGGGMTADAAVRGIREVDKEGSIAIFTEEPYPPYNRPPLSKTLWEGKPLDIVWRGTEQFDVQIFVKHPVRQLDLSTREVVTADGQRYAFDKLLLATGCYPIRLPTAAEGIIYFRTLDDYHQLRKLTETHQKFAIIGGGFIGSEMAAALQKIGKSVTMIFPEVGIGGRIFPEEVARFLNEYYQEQGVEVLSGHLVRSIVQAEDGYRIETDRGVHLEVEGVLAGLGVKPADELARQAGLQVENGIVVNQQAQTSHPDVYAAGDVARFFNKALNRYMRVEHEDNANTMGRLAGRNMAGEQETYDYLPYFYSDLFEMGYEAVGVLNSGLQTLVDWQKPFKKGAIYYLEDHRVVGVLLWNLWKRLDRARELIAGPPVENVEALRGRLF